MGLGCGGVWMGREGLLVVKDEDDDGGLSISAIFSSVGLDFYLWSVCFHVSWWAGVFVFVIYF